MTYHTTPSTPLATIIIQIHRAADGDLPVKLLAVRGAWVVVVDDVFRENATQ